MPITFFALPRELRDQIYALVLVSPTGTIHTLAPPPSKKRRQTRLTRLTILIVPRAPPPNTDLAEEKSPINESSNGDGTISLSLARVCRQISLETRRLFWECNTFYFDNAATVNSTLKIMGQIPSRLIQSISLSVSLSRSNLLNLPRSLRLLASRSRHGWFSSLTLIIDREAFIAIETCKMSAEAEKVERYDELLGILREGGGGRFDRAMRAESLMREWRIKGGLDHDTVRELHLAWGGRMEVNGEAEWVDFVHVGACVGMP